MNDLSDLIFVLRQYGPFLLAVVFVTWRDWKREDRLSKRIDELEDEMRSIVLPLVERTSTIIAHNTLAFERLERRLPL